MLHIIKNLFYWGNVIVLALVKFTTEVGRGAANMFFQWGSGRTFQPAEFGKIAIIIALAQVFSSREKPIKTLSELIRMSCGIEDSDDMIADIAQALR